MIKQNWRRKEKAVNEKERGRRKHKRGIRNKEEELTEDESKHKRKMDDDKNIGESLSTAKGLTLIKTPIHVGTPQSSILGNFSYSSQLIELEFVMVVAGKYYYKNSKRWIEKIWTKRKRGEDPPRKVSSDKTISWKIGSTPQVNVVGNSS